MFTFLVDLYVLCILKQWYRNLNIFVLNITYFYAAEGVLYMQD